MDRLSSSYPPAAPIKTKTDRPLPEVQAWLAKGWQAQCCQCMHHFTSHDRPGDTKCPDCGDIPSMRSAMAAIATLPQPQTDAYNRRETQRSMLKVKKVSNA